MSDERTKVPRLILWLFTVTAIVVTRLPGQETDATLIVALGGVAVLTLAFLSTLWSRAPASLRGWLLLVSLAVFLVPPSAQALTPWLPAWTVALLYVVTLHLFFQDDATRAPVIESTGASAKSPWLRYMPVMVVAAAVVVLPLLRTLLPPRIAATFELQTALEPLVPLAIVAAVLLAVAFLRIAIDPQAEDADADEGEDVVSSRRSKAATKEVDAA